MEFRIGADETVSKIATAIGEPARTRMLFSLMDGHARTSTELAAIAEIAPSTASVHLNRLRQESLVRVLVQGKHRYYSLAGPNVAKALEGLSVLAGMSHKTFAPSTPTRLHAARTCYDHIAGELGVLLHDRLKELGWLSVRDSKQTETYELTPSGALSLASVGIDVEEIRGQRRKFAYGCLDWSHRRPHLGGALAAALLKHSLKQNWLTQELDSRALSVTAHGRSQYQRYFGLHV